MAVNKSFETKFSCLRRMMNKPFVLKLNTVNGFPKVRNRSALLELNQVKQINCCPLTAEKYLVG